MDILCEIDPIYRDYMVTKGNQKVLYEHITQARYGMLVSAMLFCCKLTKALLSYGFELNPYDPNRNMSKSKGWTLQSSLLTLWMEKTQVNNQTKIDDNVNLLKTL